MVSALSSFPADTGRAARLDRRLALAVTLLPAAGTLIAFLLCFAGLPPGPAPLGAFVLLYLASALGLEVGFHRHVTHRAFQASRAVRLFLIGCGSMAAHGPVIWWAAVHRRHHGTSDMEGDPHSPHLSGSGTSGILKGLYHSHVGWLFQGGSTRFPGWQRQVADLYRDETLLRLHLNYYAWVAAGLLLPTLACGLIEGSLKGALLGFLWGGLVRAFAVSQCIWALNSFCHVIGRRAFDTGRHDRSRNSFLLALVTFGQGWHNNHHAFPQSAFTGLAWWQADPGGWCVRLLQLLGLVREVQRPSAAAIAAKRRARTQPCQTPS